MCALVAFVLCGCSTVQHVSYLESRTVEPTQSMHAVPLVADLQVSDARITYSEKVTLDQSVSASEVKNYIEELKSSVLFHAIKHHKAEVMVAPIIDVQQEGTHALLITIEGHPATYKNIRSATVDDTWFLPIIEPAKQPVCAPNPRVVRLFK